MALLFPKQARLLKPDDFKAVFKKPKKLSGECFDFYIRPNQVGHARLGLALPKRCLRTAVKRNRIKRLFREAFRHSAPDLTAVDIIVMAKPGIIRLPVTEYGDNVSAHWQWFLKQCEPFA